MRATMKRLFGVGVFSAALVSTMVVAENNSNPFEDVMPIMGKPVYFYKKGHIPDGAVMLFSDAQGWGEKEEAMANRLSKGGKLVIGVDTPAMLQRMEQQTDACVEVMGEIENLSRNSQYALDTPSYHFPVVAGIGLGASMALAVSSQTEPATVEYFSVVDPLAKLPGKKSLCELEGSRKPEVADDGVAHFLSKNELPFEANITLTGHATEPARALAAAWSAERPEAVRSHTSGLSQEEALLTAVHASLARAAKPVVSKNGAIENVSDLPLEEITVAHPTDTFAIFYSGDGGWRDLDKDLSAYLKEDGLPVVGVDTLRYFWHKQTPEQTTHDLERIIHSYKAKWGAKKVVLIGFSFGADLIPIIYNKLSPEARASIVQISLLGLSKDAIFEVSLDSWLNNKPKDSPQTLPEVAKIDPSLVQCFHGEEDTLNVCTQLEGTGVEIVRTKGGHHFNYEYQLLAKKIVERVGQRKL